jgi:RNA polymerase sigma-70 factor (ECF subfamily)
VDASPTTNTKFRRIYDEDFGAVTRYCLRRLPVADVNDATAEVFLVAWRRIDRVPDGPEALPWLYGVARNVVRNATRSPRRSGRLTGRLRGLARHQPADPSAVVVRRHEDEALLAATPRAHRRVAGTALGQEAVVSSPGGVEPALVRGAPEGRRGRQIDASPPSRLRRTPPSGGETKERGPALPGPSCLDNPRCPNRPSVRLSMSFPHRDLTLRCSRQKTVRCDSQADIRVGMDPPTTGGATGDGTRSSELRRHVCRLCATRACLLPEENQ